VLATPPPAFHASVHAISPASRARMTSWHRGCPVALRDLRVVSVSHWGFDGRVHTGRLVVHRDAVVAVRRALRLLFGARFPIHQMRLIDDYGADDNRSMAADNTSAFNCRRAAGSSSWSEHAYGRAIDINPRENPMILGGRVYPANARRRGRGVIRPGGVVVRAFSAAGWAWGGRWTSPRDYQHFAADGR
jgi:D-alanyl-D-alanine carboxypeptidase